MAWKRLMDFERSSSLARKVKYTWMWPTDILDEVTVSFGPLKFSIFWHHQISPVFLYPILLLVFRRETRDVLEKFLKHPVLSLRRKHIAFGFASKKFFARHPHVVGHARKQGTSFNKLDFFSAGARLPGTGIREFSIVRDNPAPETYY